MTDYTDGEENELVESSLFGVKSSMVWPNFQLSAGREEGGGRGGASIYFYLLRPASEGTEQLLITYNLCTYFYNITFLG